MLWLERQASQDVELRVYSAHRSSLSRKRSFLTVSWNYRLCRLSKPLQHNFFQWDQSHSIFRERLFDFTSAIGIGWSARFQRDESDKRTQDSYIYQCNLRYKLLQHLWQSRLTNELHCNIILWWCNHWVFGFRAQLTVMDFVSQSRNERTPRSFSLFVACFFK